MRKNGRPTKMTKDTVKKLLDAFSYGFTDLEACLYANISKQTLYDYCAKYPYFTDQKEVLKKKPTMKAKMNVLEKINNKDIETSKWYLERKAKDEFSTKSEVETEIKIKEYKFTSNLEDNE